MAADTICRIGSMTKPVVAACAMTLVEDCTLRLDDPVDEFLPELADMAVLGDPPGPLKETVPAKRAITLRDLLTFTFGTGEVVVEDGLTGTGADRRRSNQEAAGSSRPPAVTSPSPDAGFRISGNFRF